MAAVFTLLATLTGAQAQVIISGTFPVVDQQVVFDSQNVNHGFIRVTTGAEKFNLSALVLRARECSNWNISRLPYLNFSISTNTTIYPGTVGYSSTDGEPIVTFGIGEIQAPNTTRTYAILSDIVGYSSFVEADKQCLRLVLDPAGVVSKSPVTGTFPIRLSAKTLLRSKPTVTITPIGPTTGRVRTVADDVFRITILAGASHEILIKELNLRFSGATLPAGGSGLYQIVHDTSGIILGFGDLQGGNVVLTSVGELYVDAGSSLSLRVRVNSSEFQNSPNLQDALSVQIAHPCDFQWDTSTGNSDGPGLCLEPQVVPITATVNYE